ncbi:MAG: hypothetical protein ACYYK0_02785 [Candidatus Eutrophobiaceae bacterium]
MPNAEIWAVKINTAPRPSQAGITPAPAMTWGRLRYIVMAETAVNSAKAGSMIVGVSLALPRLMELRSKEGDTLLCARLAVERMVVGREAE